MTHRKIQRPSSQRFGVSGSTLSSMRRVPLAVISFWLVGSLQLATAQVATNTADQSTGQVEEIVVTAQRRAESLQDVPIAVTAVSAERLAAAGIVSTTGLGEVTPGLTVPADTGYFQPHIRGVGTSSTGAGVENPVATYVDGVYIANPPSEILSLNNIDRIEVDKGPQGTLFGRNATGGLIQVITLDPQQTPHLNADVSYGNYQDVVGRLYATDGLTNNLSADIAVRYENQGDGLGHNFYNNDEIGLLPRDLAIRSKFLFEPSSETQMRLTLDYENRGTDLTQPHLGTQYPGTFNNPYFGGPYPQGGPYDKNENEPYESAFQGGGAALQIKQDLGAVALESISAFRKSTYFFEEGLDYTPLPIIAGVAHQQDQQLSQELQISGNNSSKLKWTGGLYYFYAKDAFDPFDIDFGSTPVSPVPDTPVTIRLADSQITNSAAGYGQASYEVVQNTNLTLGARYTYERKTVEGLSTFIVDGFPASMTPYPAPASGIPSRETFDNFSYRIALDHRFNSDIMGYMSYSTGFKSGGYNLASASNPPYQPETIKASEVGMKSELFDRHLRLNVSAFNYLYDNIQVGEYVDNTEIIVNGAQAKMYGADLDAEIAVVAGLTLNGGFSYIHARFTSYPNASFIVPVGGCVPPPGGVCTGSATGYTLPYTPTTSFNFGGDYKWALTIGSITLNTNFFRSASFYGAPDNVAVQKAYTVTNASVMWRDQSDRLSAGFYGRNLGNTVYATSISEGETGEGLSYGLPRTYGVTIGYKF